MENSLNNESKVNEVREKLKLVIDPELGINIVDLGLIYDIQINMNDELNVVMTLTSSGCPMGDILYAHVEQTLHKYFGDMNPLLELTFDPAWTPDKISEEGRVFLRG